MNKILWIDTETTGLNPIDNDIIQLAYIIEIDNEVKESDMIYMAPITSKIEASALEIHGYTEEKIKQFPAAGIGIDALKTAMGRYVNKYNKKDKFIPAGYFANFDMQFLRGTFSKTGDKYFGSWFRSVILEVSAFVAKEYMDKSLDLENLKLKTVAQHYGIELVAHDAKSDIEATRNIYKKIIS